VVIRGCRGREVDPRFDPDGDPPGGTDLGRVIESNRGEGGGEGAGEVEEEGNPDVCRGEVSVAGEGR
jgi:hypothetical protein